MDLENFDGSFYLVDERSGKATLLELYSYDIDNLTTILVPRELSSHYEDPWRTAKQIGRCGKS